MFHSKTTYRYTRSKRLFFELQIFCFQLLKRRTEANKSDASNVSELKCVIDMLLEISEVNPDFTVDDVLNETISFILAVRAFR